MTRPGGPARCDTVSARLAMVVHAVCGDVVRAGGDGRQGSGGGRGGSRGQVERCNSRRGQG
eukprot:749359-Hanusia_phi.AAC.4